MISGKEFEDHMMPLLSMDLSEGQEPLSVHYHPASKSFAVQLQDGSQIQAISHVPEERYDLVAAAREAYVMQRHHGVVVGGCQLALRVREQG